MILVRRFLPFVSPALLLWSYVLLLDDPARWQRLAQLAALLIIMTLLWMMQWRLLSIEFWLSILSPLVLLASGSTILFFATSPWVQWAIIIAVTLAWAVYLESLFVFYYQPHKYTPLSLPTLRFFFAVFSITTGAMSLFVFELIGFMKLPTVIIVLSIIILLHCIYLLWNYSILSWRSALTALGLTIGFTELIWVMHYLPIGFFVKGFCIGSLFYMTFPLFQLTWRGRFERAALRQYIGIGGVLLILVLLTARWLVD